MIRNLIGILLIVLHLQPVHSQYLNEIGVFGGGSNYSGDIGREMFIYPNSLAGGIIYRRNLNERISLRGTMSIYPLKDSDKNSSNPVRQARGFSFTNTLAEATLGVEFNYYDYDITSYDKRFTPYIFAEVAGFKYSTIGSITDGEKSYNSAMAFAIPIGFGFKGGIDRNWGWATELRTRYALVDNLDFNNTKIPSLNFGNPDTNDWYFFVGVGITYSFGRPPCAVPPQY